MSSSTLVTTWPQRSSVAARSVNWLKASQPFWKPLLTAGSLRRYERAMVGSLGQKWQSMGHENWPGPITTVTLTMPEKLFPILVLMWPSNTVLGSIWPADTSSRYSMISSELRGFSLHLRRTNTLCRSHDFLSPLLNSSKPIKNGRMRVRSVGVSLLNVLRAMKSSKSSISAGIGTLEKSISKGARELPQEAMLLLLLLLLLFFFFFKQNKFYPCSYFLFFPRKRRLTFY